MVTNSDNEEGGPKNHFCSDVISEWSSIEPIRYSIKLDIERIWESSCF